MVFGTGPRVLSASAMGDAMSARRHFFQVFALRERSVSEQRDPFYVCFEKIREGFSRGLAVATEANKCRDLQWMLSQKMQNASDANSASFFIYSHFNVYRYVLVKSVGDHPNRDGRPSSSL